MPRPSPWALLACAAATYLLSSAWFLCGGPTEYSGPLLRPNATWWRATADPYNLSLLDNTRDYGLLVDRENFRFMTNNRRCDGDRSVFLLVFVHSAPGNFEKRKAIRSTWGREENLSREGTMRLIFLLGAVSDAWTQRRLDAENAHHRDLVQGNFADSYRNLTYKHVMGLKWVTYFCRQARFVFKADDDIFVDVFQLAGFLKDTFGSDPTTAVANLMMCALVRSPHVKRSQRSKWRVSFREYPGRRYPSYCSGWGVLMSPDVVFRLYRLSSQLPYFWVDDVHVTGVMASKLGIAHVDWTERLAEVNVDQWLASDGSEHRPGLFGQPDADPKTIAALWNKTVQWYEGRHHNVVDRERR